MYIPVLLFGNTVATILLILIYGLLGFILLILICGLLRFALLMWLGQTGTIYEAADSIVRRIRGGSSEGSAGDRLSTLGAPRRSWRRRR